MIFNSEGIQMVIITKPTVKQAPKMCNLFCNIVELFNLVVASCAKTDWINYA